MTSLVQRLQVRESTSAKNLTTPGPTDDELAEVMRAAVAVPEHGAIRPWRFLMVREAGQRRLSEVFVDDLLAVDPEASETEIAKRRDGPLRSPLLIVVAVSPRAHPKVPEIEQVVAGGLSAFVIQSCFHDMGYGAVWVTGQPSYSERVKTALGLAPTDHIIGFVHVGTRGPGASASPPKKRPEPSDYIVEWTGS
ncbi:nitroreductase family protein [Roseospira marina]|uniref:nitroreductase family protein n=1 Tax=Roseospira marina TaxID=140057 RepID=UPI0014795739|nr:nitroreductase [Roseospira marina]MBB4313336.1 nitroreductase [Roseospira marina]MBB5085923.1 nitroreductase [Roseospira marina]